MLCFAGTGGEEVKVTRWGGRYFFGLFPWFRFSRFMTPPPSGVVVCFTSPFLRAFLTRGFLCAVFLVRVWLVYWRFF